MTESRSLKKQFLSQKRRGYKIVDWNAIGDFERHPKLNDVLDTVGKSVNVKFMDDGKEIKADVLASALKAKGIKGIKAKDTIVFVVGNKNEKNELWLSATSYTNLQELKRIRTENGNTLLGAMVKVSRVSKDNPETASFKFERA